MKQHFFISIVLMSLFVFGTLHAQSRTSGHMVVPIGYEAYDSLRFGIWDADAYALPITDSVHCTYDFFLGGINEITREFPEPKRAASNTRCGALFFVYLYKLKEQQP